MMESTVGMPAPTMEMLGFKNHVTQIFRTDSEELFKSWLTNGEASNRIILCLSTLALVLRISTDLAIQKKPNDDIQFAQTTTLALDSSNDPNSTRTGVEKGLQASNLFLAKAWFHSSQPMTRSRSSELRKRYVAMQNSQTPIGIEAMQEASANGINNFKQEPTNTNGFNNNVSTYENPNQFNAFMSPSNSSSSTFNNPQVDKISSVVSMLKGTLERKKLGNQVEKEPQDDSSFGYYSAAEVLGLNNQGQENHAYETFQDLSTLGISESGVLRTIEESLMEGIMDPLNTTTRMSTISQEPSQSESSAAPYVVVSNGFDICDDPCVSVQAPSVCESSRNQMGTRRSPEDCSRSKDFRERTYENSKEDQKKGGLIRYGSITSAGSAERGDPTKKRRVERSRKMAEAKERSSTPTVPSDMQSILKRCENLEKEDSEQTKQIEELQKQNQDLSDEKERLLEEIERIISETGKM
ncbi:hypothetical protein DH2020_049274 [Rehmannia glutinosa]|uniref:Uncharacterized protein n=1 Tax=Rehmannia glutinosa TaxID=99300 RepID=A0ABR0U4B1_REHGL